jgi:hypothetical protein
VVGARLVAFNNIVEINFVLKKNIVEINQIKRVKNE